METVKLYLEARKEGDYIVINTGEQIPYDNLINTLNGFGTLIKDAKLAINSEVLSADEQQIINLLRASKSNAAAIEAKKFNEALNQANQKVLFANTKYENIKSRYKNDVEARKQEYEKRRQDLEKIIID